MEQRSDHARFQDAVREVMASRRFYHPGTQLEEWVLQCYEDEDIFFTFFPDPGVRKDIIDRLEHDTQSRWTDMHAMLAVVQAHGVSKRDIEELKYEMPTDEEREQWEVHEQRGMREEEEWE